MMETEGVICSDLELEGVLFALATGSSVMVLTWLTVA